MPDLAYGQTDVMHDPNYLRAMLQNPRTRAQAEQALRQLEFEGAHRQQLAEFGQRQTALETERSTRAQDREAALQSRRDQFTEAERGRTARAGELNQLRENTQADRRSAGLLNLAQSPELT